MKTDLTRRCFLHGCASVSVLGLGGLFACRDPQTPSPYPESELAERLARARSPLLDRPGAGTRLAFAGAIGERLSAMQHNWLIPLPRVNAELTAMFDNPEDNTNLLWWLGEFAGKYLIGALQVLRITRNPDLEAIIRTTVDKLMRCQGADGYLGPFPRSHRFKLWDGWGHYHCMLGLFEVYRHYAPSPPDAAWAANVLECVRRAADLLYRHFVLGGISVGSVHGNDRAQNEALAHILALLVQEPDDTAGRAEQYRALCDQIAADWQDPTSGSAQYLTDTALYLSKQPRWESLPNLQALAELHYGRGNVAYAEAFRRLWSSIRGNAADGTGDVHNNGGFSSREQASGNPYDPRPIETCGTVAWMALCIDRLRLDGSVDTLAADELELSTYNAVLGFQNPEATQFTYDTPMGGIPVSDQAPIALAAPLAGPPAYYGERRPTRYDLHWQQPGEITHDLTCCSANGPRGLGCLSEWAVMVGADAIVLNFYGPSTFVVPWLGQSVSIEQVTTYPYGAGTISLTVTCSASIEFTLMLRIPSWAAGAQASRNGTSLAPLPGSYLALQGPWSRDQITLELPLDVRAVAGKPAPNAVPGSAEGRSSLYRGPILLAYDERLDSWSATPGRGTLLPRIDPRTGQAATSGEVDTKLSLRFQAAGAAAVTLCDFASAGSAAISRIDAPLLTGRTWQLSRQRDATGTLPPALLGERVRFLSTGGIGGTAGAISGVTGDNERYWSLDAVGHLIIHAADGRPTTKFSWGAVQNGRRVLRGPFENPNIVHQLSELDGEVAGKTFQLRRQNDGSLLSLLAFGSAGALSGANHPNEFSWAYEEQALVIRDQAGRTTSRFSSVRSERGRTMYSGRSTLSPDVGHELIECNTGFSNKVFRFSRADGSVIAERVRLIAGAAGNIIEGLFGSPNEASWRVGSGGKLEFLANTGAVSTRFEVAGAHPQAAFYRGPFLPDPRITHVLTELDLDWSPGRRLGMGIEQWVDGASYVSWLEVR